MAEAEKELSGLVYDMPSDVYHGTGGIFSSSQLKDLLDDEEIFYNKYIAKTVEKESIPAFDIGSYFHTAILEPHKLKDESAVYGGIRRGKEWEAFKEANKGKAIITQSEQETADTLIRAVKNSPVAMNRINRGQPEVSAFVTIYVYRSEIYSEDGKLVLGRYGWEPAKEKVNKKEAVKLRLKVRADLLADDFILDLKSTTGNAKSKNSMMRKVSDYTYDLSAALYLDIFSLVLKKPMSDFIWTFASKDMGNSRSYMATQDNIQIGRAKWKKAIVKLAFCIQSGWQFEDYLDMLPPNSWEKDILQPQGSDLL